MGSWKCVCCLFCQTWCDPCQSKTCQNPSDQTIGDEKKRKKKRAKRDLIYKPEFVETYFFLNMGQPRPLLFIFHCKAFYNNDLQTWHSVETFPHLWQVVFAFRAYLSSREGILGRCHRGLLALQDGEVTIITQTIEDTMFLAKLRRVIRVVWFTMLKSIE